MKSRRAYHFVDKCHHIVNVKRCHHIVNKGACGGQRITAAGTPAD